MQSCKQCSAHPHEFLRAIVRAAGSPQSGTEHRVRLSQRGDGRAVRTYQARLGVVDDAPLRAYAAVFGRALRSLHASRHSGNVRPKPDFMRAFGLTSRQYNAVKFSLDGMESSIVELRPGRIADLRHRIKAADKKLAKLHDATPQKTKKSGRSTASHRRCESRGAQTERSGALALSVELQSA